MTRNPHSRRLYARLSGRRAVAHANHASRPVDVERKHEKAERVRRESFHGPPLTEWERMAMYGAVEAERNR